MNPGDLVRMSAKLKSQLRSTGSGVHVDEFGGCVGIVVGPLDYNNCKPGEPGYDLAKVGPEIDVRWQPSNLRYGYHPSDLERV
jgi:hypothetical protein